MKKIILLLTLSLSVTAFAQYKRAGGGAFSFGVQTLETAGLRQFYTGAPTLSTANFTFGGYGYAQFNNLLIGFSGAGVYGNEVEDAENVYYFSGGNFALDFGYKVINKQKWSLYPMVNLGIGGVGYTISQKAEIAVGGGEVVTFNNANYTWGNVMYGVGVRFERYFKFKDDCDGGKNAGLFGLEAGYINSPNNADWMAGSRTFISGGPDFSFESFYVRLTFGGFGGK
jgi:hypothetical protein